MNKINKIENNQKSRKDIGKIATKVIATILALLMVLAVGGTLVYYLINM